jgi:hypothetical protein
LPGSGVFEGCALIWISFSQLHPAFIEGVAVLAKGRQAFVQIIAK